MTWMRTTIVILVSSLNHFMLKHDNALVTQQRCSWCLVFPDRKTVRACRWSSTGCHRLPMRSQELLWWLSSARVLFMSKGFKGPCWWRPSCRLSTHEVNFHELKHMALGAFGLWAFFGGNSFRHRCIPQPPMDSCFVTWVWSRMTYYCFTKNISTRLFRWKR